MRRKIVKIFDPPISLFNGDELRLETQVKIEGMDFMERFVVEKAEIFVIGKIFKAKMIILKKYCGESYENAMPQSNKKRSNK